MSTCARCGATPADLFSTSGDVLCRRCFSAEQQRGADARAAASMQDPGIEGVRYAKGPESPRKAILAGVTLLAVGIGGGGALLVLTGTLYFWFLFIAGAGFVSLARGLMLRRGR